jgi:putative ABC transport system ATP-binding protein
MTSIPAVATRDLVRIYGEGDVAVRALDGIDVEIPSGQFVVILGPSGSGKTTLLNIVGGIDAPTSGSVEVAGTDLASLSSSERTGFRRDHVGFVFQFFNLIPTLTAYENVRLISEIAGSDGEASREALESVGLGQRLDNFPAALSGGEQQRVAVARAIAKSPPLLLGDEPTGALDLETGRQVLKLLHKLNRTRGITMLLVTHSSVIAGMADRVLHLRDGEIVGDERIDDPKTADELVW